jgi:hypothetical protein
MSWIDEVVKTSKCNNFQQVPAGKLASGSVIHHYKTIGFTSYLDHGVDVARNET